MAEWFRSPPLMREGQGSTPEAFFHFHLFEGKVEMKSS
jgi:hypothetical protein